MIAHVRTVRSLELAYGGGTPALDDPAELYHEASKAYPRLVTAQMQGATILARRTDLQVSTQRSVRRNPELDWLELPEPRLPDDVSFAEVLRERRSEREFGSGALDLATVATLLAAAYGVSRRSEAGQPFRTVPSGGALYPLELYVAARAVDGVEPGVYHFDPLRNSIGRVRDDAALGELETASVYPEITSGCALIVLVACVFWRTRFKYGLRGFRFALLEAGHVVQNLVLAAAALELAAIPLGGYYDRRVDETLLLDGVNDATVYAACVGTRP